MCLFAVVLPAGVLIEVFEIVPVLDLSLTCMGDMKYVPKYMRISENVGLIEAL